MDLSSWPRRIGLPRGSVVHLMADLTRMAWNARRAGQRFDAAALLDAFVQQVGPEGTVLVSTFTFHLESGAAFDIRRTPSISGALAQAALAHPAFRRTPHPLHSFAVAGAGADELVNSTEVDSFGNGSPFAFLERHRGMLVYFDMPLNDAFTQVHFVEQTIGVPYRRHRSMRFRYTDIHGNEERRTFRLYAKRPGHHMDLTLLQPALEAAGALRHGEVDGSRYSCLDLVAAHAVVERDIRTNGARSFHFFSWERWARDVIRRLFRRLGVMTSMR